MWLRINAVLLPATSLTAAEGNELPSLPKRLFGLDPDLHSPSLLLVVRVQIKQRSSFAVISQFIHVFVRGADQVVTLEPPFLLRDQDMICIGGVIKMIPLEVVRVM